MIRAMRAHRGVGLAAPQVGLGTRLIVADVGDGPYVLVNPRIVSSSGTGVDWEGCLSYPGLLAEVERAETVTVEAVGPDGKPVWVEGEGFLARVLQHEIDHLDGVVILDRARSVEKVEPEPGREVKTVPEVATRTGVAGSTGNSLAGEGPGNQAGGVTPLRVAFMGTPVFARPTLEVLLASGHTVAGVVTRPDRAAGRGGRTVLPSAVKRAARAFGLPVWEGTARDVSSSLADVLRRWGVDVAVVVAYGVILPHEVLTAPRLGCLNLHASLLPDYRGPAPVQRVIMDGRDVTGVTVIRMDEGVDTGDILGQVEVPVGGDDTGGVLHDRLSELGADLVLAVLDQVAEGRAVPRPQPPGLFVTAPLLGPSDEVIDWSRPAVAIGRQVRALNPRPGAHTLFRGRRIKVWWADVLPHASGLAATRTAGPRPGEIVSFEAGAPVVATGEGRLALRVVQPAGGREMKGQEFANGHRIAVGDVFGDPDR